MKQLSGLDASFLYMETAAQFGHVSSVSVYDRPPDQPDYDPLTAWRDQIQQRLHLLEPLRRKLRFVPMRLDHPYWIEDADFDIDFHVRHNALPPPGDDRLLGELVSRIIGRPMDRARPLWETYVIEGLAGNRFATLTKLHHSTIDGASGTELLTLMLDASAEGDVIPPPETVWAPEPIPSDGEVLIRAAGTLIRKPGRAILLATRTTRELGVATRNPAMVAAADRMRASLRGPLGAVLNAGRTREAALDGVPGPKLFAPRTPFNATITPHRRFAFKSVPLSLVKDVKNACGATLNDVVMAVCAGGLRTYLQRHDCLPDDPLVAMVPVSIRTGKETEKWSNRVSSIVASLPTNEPDAEMRVKKVHDAMAQAKEMFEAVPAASLTDFTQFAPPAVFAQAMRTATRLSGRFRTPVNVTISNVPGPREPLYAAGAQLVHFYPVSTVVDGQGLNITVQSYLDSLDFGLVSCRELVPDLWDMLDDILDDLYALAATVGVETDRDAAASNGRSHAARANPGASGASGASGKASPTKKAAAKKTASSTSAAATKQSAAKKRKAAARPADRRASA